jgi:hypothetical protein
VQNVRVLLPLRRPALALTAIAATVALAVSGCSANGGDTQKSSSGTSSGVASSSGSASASGSSSASASASPSSSVPIPSGVSLTDQGSALSFGDPATVIFQSTQNRGTILQLRVSSVQKGKLADFKGFILDDSYKRKADYFYAKLTVKNVGEGDVGGVAVPLWGVSASNTLLPAVNFTTTFKACPSKPLPAKFGRGKSLRTCLVYLSPNRGSLQAVSYRPSQAFNPITWKGTIKPPAATPKKKGKKG